MFSRKRNFEYTRCKMKKTLDIILILIKNVAFSNLRPFEKISYNKNQLNIPSLSLSFSLFQSTNFRPVYVRPLIVFTESKNSSKIPRRRVNRSIRFYRNKSNRWKEQGNKEMSGRNFRRVRN